MDGSRDLSAEPAGAGQSPAFEIAWPAEAGPLVFASPHSGRLYPPDMRAAVDLPEEALRGSEDLLVDRLLEQAPAFGCTVISAVYGRAYIDVNRGAYELDPEMFDGALPAYARSRTARVQAGLGSIARKAGRGYDIYDRRLTFEEAAARIERVHRPYHQALRGLLQGALSRFGAAVLIDWHSMPGGAAGADPRTGRPLDMVLGDRFGAACAPALTAFVDRMLSGLGYAVGRNAPYAGGHVTETYGRPAAGVHALQIEINRPIYLDAEGQGPGPGFDRLKRDLETLFSEMAAERWPERLR